MCGIAGFIGHSKRPRASYELMTALFKYLEIRGVDASGFWATEESHDNHTGSVFYHKEATKSSDFVKTQHWQSVRKKKINMMVAHARATSRGGGAPSNNINNHPFVSTDRKIGMVHNGNLDEARYLKQNYQTLSETDSELLLRIFEHGFEQDYFAIDGVPDDIAQKMTGISDIWSFISTGAMAVAIGERIDNYARGLWLFRNDKRPLWLADLRNQLGQVFFFSSPDIWYSAMDSDEKLKNLCWGSQKLVELPADQVWYMSIDKEDVFVTNENFYKMAVDVTETDKDFEKGEYKKIIYNKPEFPVVSIQKEEEPVPVTIQKVKAFPVSNTIYRKPQCVEPDYDLREDYYPKNTHDSICDSIKDIAERISVDATNLSLEGSICSNDYDMLIESLEQIRADLEGTLRLLGRS